MGQPAVSSCFSKMGDEMGLGQAGKTGQGLDIPPILDPKDKGSREAGAARGICSCFLGGAGSITALLAPSKYQKPGRAGNSGGGGLDSIGDPREQKGTTGTSLLRDRTQLKGISMSVAWPGLGSIKCLL